ncbi:hypothetical protein CEXT_198551 [Caerostris extrusa]|uniref:Uncharacterized protein n=1 Tax=Caerostris extrusa TaxID=172846 RepID=A0AAV4XUI4_CAEEX|nr:hypothetical protein CEXT_198551 [Caerostris extrusa]
MRISSSNGKIIRPPIVSKCSETGMTPLSPGFNGGRVVQWLSACLSKTGSTVAQWSSACLSKWNSCVRSQ